MPEKTKKYKSVIFEPEVIIKAEEAITKNLKKRDKEVTLEIRSVRLSPEEEWMHDTDEEFFADYHKGVLEASFVKRYGFDRKITFRVNENDTSVSVFMPTRTDVERVFNIFEANVEKYYRPKQPKVKTKIKTDWVKEITNKVDKYCPIAGRKLKTALIKLESNNKEEWQSACILIRDAWIELVDKLCKIKNVDTSDIAIDSVVDKLKKLKIHNTDEQLFNLARGAFNLNNKRHDRNISHYDAIACVISTIVSMKTVIQEVFNASS